MMNHLRTRVLAPLVSFFILLFFFLATWHNLWDPSSLTRESNRALGSENAESQQLDCWGIPLVSFFFFFFSLKAKLVREDLKKNKDIPNVASGGRGALVIRWTRVSRVAACPVPDHVPMSHCLGHKRGRQKWPQAKQVLPRFELGSLDSKSRVLMLHK